MRRSLLFAFAVLAFSAAPSRAAPFSHGLLDQVLQTHVDSQGKVDYPALKESRAYLDAYIDSLGRVSPRSHPDRFPTPHHELAYWINAYNAFVIKGVIDAYPIASVKDIKAFNGFFRRMKSTAGDQELTLDDIENKIIRPVYKDPRIHFVVNCGAVSCPELENRAFTGEDLEARLEAALRRFAASPKHVRLDPRNNELHLSRILDWYGGDFARWFPQDRAHVPAEPTLVDYLLPYLPEETAAHLRQHPDADISFNEYDWGLNVQTKE